MIKIGINGFGRIGKYIFIQLLSNLKFIIKCINAIGIKINKNFSFKIIFYTKFKINHQIIKLFSDREPKKLSWDLYDCEYLFDCTCSFLIQKYVLNIKLNILKLVLLQKI